MLVFFIVFTKSKTLTVDNFVNCEDMSKKLNPKLGYSILQPTFPYISL